MKTSWGLTRKIRAGTKTIESRWYKTRYPPFDKISAGDVVYFKDSGKPVTLKATVARVEQFSRLTPSIVISLLEKYGECDGIEEHERETYFQHFKDKKYCVLVFLTNVTDVEPFFINKQGHGLMSSWICVPTIDMLKN